MKTHKNLVCTVEPPEPSGFVKEPGELLGFVKHSKYGVLLMDYQKDLNGKYFAHFLEGTSGMDTRCMWVSLPGDTRVLALKTATFVEVTS